MRWHFHLTPPADGPSNMALDEALLRRAARTGEAVFRIYGWSVPTLSLGRNQRARDCYDLDAAARLGVAFVRRPTGGRALLHHREVTYCAVLPCVDAAAAREAYGLINELLLAALGALGVSAQRATEPSTLPPGLRPCFDAPSADEIVVGERKLVGSAQWRRGGALLQHGSILVHDDQAIIQALLRHPLPATPRAATLVDALGREPEFAELAGAVRTALGRLAEDGRVATFAPGDDLEADYAALSAVYRDDGWTWRR